MTRETKVEIANGLRRAGATYSEIASIMQVSQPSVWGYLNDPHGIRKARHNASYRQRARLD